MKTKIAVILILIYEIFAALFISGGISSNNTCGGVDDPIPPYFTPLLFVASIPLMIAACILLTKIRKAALWSCLILALINLGILCWGIIYYLGSHCDGPNQITPDTDAAKLTIIAAAIIVLSMLLLLSDVKHISHITAAENTEKPKRKSPLPLVISSIVIYILVIMLTADGVYCTTQAPYTSVKSEIENAVTAYMANPNRSSQLPIISANATFTLTNSNDSFYIINMSALLTSNGGLMKTIPTGVIQLPGPNNDNCDGGAIGCSNKSHYIWGINSLGCIVSKLEYPPDRNLCQKNACGNCDGYQDVWP